MILHTHNNTSKLKNIQTYKHEALGGLPGCLGFFLHASDNPKWRPAKCFIIVIPTMNRKFRCQRIYQRISLCYRNSKACSPELLPKQMGLEPITWLSLITDNGDPLVSFSKNFNLLTTDKILAGSLPYLWRLRIMQAGFEPVNTFLW
jgi:hypothetical protein